MKTNKTFIIVSRSFLLRKRHVSDKSCRENQNRFLYPIKGKGKGKFTLEQVTKIQKGSRGIALHFL